MALDTIKTMKRLLYLLVHRLGVSFSPAQLSVFSFVIMSVIGGTLLWFTEHNRTVIYDTPVMRPVILTVKDNYQSGKIYTVGQEEHVVVEKKERKGENFVDTLFTAVSALCVTGLTSTDFTRFTLTGQIITMILIQMGGLGIIVFTSIFAIAIARGISEHENFQKIVGGILDTEGNQVIIMIKYVTLYTALIEGIATVILGVHLQFFSPTSLMDGINPWWWALFHSVSAFNNAGFGLQNNNLVNYVTDPVVNLVISSLIILGGIGYPVLVSIHILLRKYFIKKEDKEQRELTKNLHSVSASPVQLRVALWGTLVLIIVGTIIPLLEPTNRALLSHYSIPQQILIAFFQSVSTRTAGFNTIDIGSLGIATLFVYICLMYIGTNPAGTGGGIKVPTVAVLFGYIKDWFGKPGEPVKLLGRNVSKFAVSHAIRLFFVSVIFVATITLLICFIEDRFLITPDPTFNFLKILFEVVSAFGTVGLSMGFTGGVTSFSAILAPLSKYLLIIAMLVGRLGPLTILASLPWKKDHDEKDLTPDYQDAQKIQIG